MMRSVITAQRRRHSIFYSGCNKPVITENKGEQIVNVFKNAYAKTPNRNTVDLNSEYVSQR